MVEEGEEKVKEVANAWFGELVAREATFLVAVLEKFGEEGKKLLKKTLTDYATAKAKSYLEKHKPMERNIDTFSNAMGERHYLSDLVGLKLETVEKTPTRWVGRVSTCHYLPHWQKITTNKKILCDLCEILMEDYNIAVAKAINSNFKFTKFEYGLVTGREPYCEAILELESE